MHTTQSRHGAVEEVWMFIEIMKSPSSQLQPGAEWEVLRMLRLNTAKPSATATDWHTPRSKAGLWHGWPALFAWKRAPVDLGVNRLKSTGLTSSAVHAKKRAQGTPGYRPKRLQLGREMQW
mmetsp:Transcript_53562/g.171657  ORF Transcript_53562/g.171657 Transcript_53562/m.171657 type:complete len:121 (-) Transcript_53562:151-513(-)